MNIAGKVVIIWYLQVQSGLQGLGRAIRVSRWRENLVRNLGRADAGAVERGGVVHGGSLLINPVVPAAVAVAAARSLASAALERARHALLGQIVDEVVRRTLVLALLASFVFRAHLAHLMRKFVNIAAG